MIRSNGVMIQAIRAALAVGTERLTRARMMNIRTVRRFARREDGVAAVEFAIVAAPFLALMFAIMETALVFFASQTLETAVADSARLIMTGQAQTQSFSQAQFKSAVCAKVGGLFDCAGGLKVDVKTYSSFGSVDNSKPLDANGNLKTNFGYQPGGPGEIVVVRLMYEWPVYASLLGFNLGNMAGNKRLIMATAAFRNEPYQ
jgi:Flp pilus assembly protein TadG